MPCASRRNAGRRAVRLPCAQGSQPLPLSDGERIPRMNNWRLESLNRAGWRQSRAVCLACPARRIASRRKGRRDALPYVSASATPQAPTVGLWHAQPAASGRVACGKREVSVMLRWYFDGSSTVLRWYFEGFKVFLPLFLQSLLPAHPPCHLPFLHSSLYPYKHSPR
jgi:hypothetical protein